MSRSLPAWLCLRSETPRLQKGKKYFHRRRPTGPVENNLLPLWPIYSYDAETRQLNSIQLLSQASKQRVVCAQQRDVTMLMTSLHCHPQSRQLSCVELRRRCELVISLRYGNAFPYCCVGVEAILLNASGKTPPATNYPL